MGSGLLTWRTKTSQNVVYSERNEFAPMGANSFLYKMTFNLKMKMRVSSTDSVPIHLTKSGYSSKFFAISQR